jgi:hypothetical protein
MFVSLLAIWSWPVAGQPQATSDPLTQEQADFFERNVRPIFLNRCSACHGEKVRMASLNLTTAGGFLKGADTGPVVTPGDPSSSRLLRAVGYAGKVKMPPTGKLPDAEIDALTKWVEMGTPWPKNDALLKNTPEDARYWAFQPMRRYAPPTVKQGDWVSNPIDQFVLAKLEETGLTPSSPAENLALLRRAKMDLHGLPPNEEEVKEFLSDTGSGAYARLVDRLLASPRYGEQWGRHWLDVARYADSTGLDEDLRLPYSWRYRDYVIGAFNEDLPYDRFVREQLAGDLLPAAHQGDINAKGIVATGFLALGPKPLAQQDKLRVLYDVVDEQIDTTSKAFLGITVACARCHDHKFDPISTRDYYSLASIFASTKYFEDIKAFVSKVYFAPLTAQDVYQRYSRSLERVKARELQIEALLITETRRYISARLLPRLADYMVADYEVFTGGQTIADVASREHLDQKTLEKWVDYLKPGAEFRPYLAQWHAATASTARQVATQYQEKFRAVSNLWDAELSKWMASVATAVKLNQKVADKPTFESGAFGTGDARFFADITGPEGAFGVRVTEQESLLSGESKLLLTVLRSELEAIKKEVPPEPPMACAVAEGESVQQRVLIRGNHQNPGDLVAKQFPVVLAGNSQPLIERGSGRKELAEWLTRAEHPLTSRVMVNRIWQWHFGEGIVRTPNNFGSTGERPSHPELLDYLARKFVEQGWSIKSMHRMIMLSSTYQMSSHSSEDARKKDPGNRMLSHFSRRRLTVEEMRDSFLAVDGSLDLTMGGRIADGLHADEYEKRPTYNPDKIPRRTVYLPLVRNKLPSVFKLFDFVDTTASAESRTESNIAPQALFMMNSEFIHERAHSLASILITDRATTDAGRVGRAYRMALARPATPNEIESALTYLKKYPKNGETEVGSSISAWDSLCRILLASDEFNYVD